MVAGPANYPDAHDSEQRTTTVPRDLQHRAGIPHNARGTNPHERLQLQQAAVGKE